MLDTSQQMKEVMENHMQSLQIAPSPNILKMLANQLMIEETAMALAPSYHAS